MVVHWWAEVVEEFVGPDGQYGRYTVSVSWWAVNGRKWGRWVWRTGFHRVNDQVTKLMMRP